MSPNKYLQDICARNTHALDLESNWRIRVITMSTPKTTTTVKQALLEKLHQEILPELEQLIQALPDELLDFQRAETGLRQGMLKLAQGLLEKWAAVANLAVERPCCSQCGVPMRNKGRVPSTVVTSLGDVPTD